MANKYLHFYLYIPIILTTHYQLQTSPLRELTFCRPHSPLKITVMVCRRFWLVFFLCSFLLLRINPTLRAINLPHNPSQNPTCPSFVLFSNARPLPDALLCTFQIFLNCTSQISSVRLLSVEFSLNHTSRISSVRLLSVVFLCISVPFPIFFTLVLFTYFRSVSIFILTPVFIKTVLNPHSPNH